MTVYKRARQGAGPGDRRWSYRKGGDFHGMGGFDKGGFAKGFFGRRKNCFSLAIRAVEKGLQKAYIGRKLKKRAARSLSNVAKDCEMYSTWNSSVHANGGAEGRPATAAQPYSVIITGLLNVSRHVSMSFSKLKGMMSVCPVLVYLEREEGGDGVSVCV